MGETLVNRASQTFATWRKFGGTLMLRAFHHTSKANEAHRASLRNGGGLSEEATRHEWNALVSVVGGFVIWSAGAVGGIAAGALGGRYEQTIGSRIEPSSPDVQVSELLPPASDEAKLH